MSLASPAVGQVPPTQSGAKSAEIHRALHLLATRRFEFAADLTLSVFDAPGTRQNLDKRLSVEHLQRMLELSASAVQPHMRIPAPRSGGSEDTFAFDAAATRLRLDGASLRNALLRRLTLLDRRASAASFANLSPLPIRGNVSCSEKLVPVLDPKHFESHFAMFGESAIEVLNTATSLQDAASLVAALAAGAVPVQVRSAAISRVGAILHSSFVADRVFSTLELRADLGHHIEELSRTIPPSEAFALVDAYLKYLVRHLAQERCPDVRNSAGDDLVVTSTSIRAARLAARFQVPFAITRPSYSEAALPDQQRDHLPEFPAGLSDTLARLQALGTPQAENDVKQRLAEINGASGSCGRCLWVRQMEANLGAIVQSGSVPVASAASTYVASLLEDARFKAAEPAVWIYYMRYTLRLCGHPNKALVQGLLHHLENSADGDVATYLSIHRVVPVVPAYNEKSIANTQDLMPSLQ